MRKSVAGNVPERGEVVAENRGWVLIELEAAGGWLKLKLVSKVARPKGNFWLDWNGERLAGSSDAKLLEANCPDVFDWVCEQLRGIRP